MATKVKRKLSEVEGSPASEKPTLASVIAMDDDDFREALTKDPSWLTAKDEATEWTLLHHATKHGRVTCVEFLLEAKADVTCTTHHDSTALHIAACNGFDAVATVLIDHGCPLEALDNKKNTALMRAGQHGHAQVAKLLLDAGADMTSRNGDGMSALDRALAGDHAQVVALLEHHGSKPAAS